MQELTDREMEGLSELSSYIDENGYPPTIRELGERLGVSKTPAKECLDRLERKGAIERDGTPRGIRLLSRYRDNRECKNGA
jgi:repressor LexA